MIHDLTIDQITGKLDGRTLMYAIECPGRITTICVDDDSLFSVQIFARERIMKILHIHTFDTPFGKKQMVAESDMSLGGFRADKDKPNVIVCGIYQHYWRNDVQIKLVEEWGDWDSACEYYNDVFKDYDIYLEPKEDKGATE